jgi:dTMP kinase
LPALNQKKIIICDRFIDSTFAYQVYGKKVSKNFIDIIHKYILKGIKPSITFVLKVSNKSSKLRLKKRKTKNRYDNFAQSFYNKAQNSFIKLAKNKKNYFILDSSLNNSDLEKKIFKIICKKLKI